MTDEKRTIVIFDIDGTVANISHRRHLVREKPMDWPRFFREAVNDTVNEHVKAMFVILSRQPNFELYFVSGRPEDNRALTEEWLRENGMGNYQALYMRGAKDSRSDDIVKREIYDQYFAQRADQILCVFDDRPKVIRMWRSLGLPVFDCGDGVEF